MLQTSKPSRPPTSAHLPARDEEFVWSRNRLSASDLSPFAKLSVSEIIDKLRQSYGVTVVILDRAGKPGAPRDGSLLAKNLPADGSLLNYFSSQKFDPDMSGVFLPANSYPVLSTLGKRPGSDRPVIVVTTGTQKGELLHEVAHALLDRRFHQAATSLFQGVRVDPRTRSQIELEQSKSEFNQAQDRGLPAAALSAAAKKVTIALIRNAEGLFGEEFDVAHLIVKNSTPLGVSPASRMVNLRYMKEMLDTMKQELTPVSAIFPLLQGKDLVETKAAIDAFNDRFARAVAHYNSHTTKR